MVDHSASLVVEVKGDEVGLREEVEDIADGTEVLRSHMVVNLPSLWFANLRAQLFTTMRIICTSSSSPLVRSALTS